MTGEGRKMKISSSVRDSVQARTRARRRTCGAASIRALAGESRASRNFQRACQSHRQSAVCEVRSASQACTAVARGAPAVSVRTWSEHGVELFADLADVCATADVPTLQRDLIASEYQVWEARAFGADAVTLLPALVGPGDLARFATLAERLRMTAVFELYDEEDAEVAVDLGAQVTVAASSDFERVRNIRDSLPPTLLVLAEAYGDMVLIGEELVPRHEMGEAA
jgi:indole-3-glycerol phosphate synthase